MKPNSSPFHRLVILATVLTGFSSVHGEDTLPVAQGQAIHEADYLKIGGIEQWGTIDGEEISNPVILFLHGGPRSTFTPFAKTLFGSWSKDFTVVQWD